MRDMSTILFHSHALHAVNKPVTLVICALRDQVTRLCLHVQRMASLALYCFGKIVDRRRLIVEAILLVLKNVVASVT